MELVVGQPGELENYWHHVEHESWFQCHPFKAAAVSKPQSTFPLRMWGDDAVNTKKKSLYAVSVASAVCLGNTSLLSRFLALVVRVEEFVSLEPLWIALA